VKRARAGLKACTSSARTAPARTAVVQAFRPAIHDVVQAFRPAIHDVGQAFRPAVAVALLSISACAANTKYVVPTADIAPAFRENADWKIAQPGDDVLRGNWWELFGDPDLNALEQQIEISNQTLKAAAAQFAQARAIVRGTRAGLFPQVDAGPSASRAELSGNRPTSTPHRAANDFVLPVDASYEADVWGRIHSAVDASRADAQASAADLETARLSLHAELAADYFTLRGIDRDRQLLESAVESFEKALELTQNRFQGGIASQADVAQAETVLETTRAQAVDVGVDRSALEHAIAVLVGRPASIFSIAVAPLNAAPPSVPAGLPSELLERRPDIAAAERRVAAANAQLGVANAAFYPRLILSGAAGFESSPLGSLLTGTSSFWTIGPALLVNVFDAGRRHAVSDQARAVQDQATAVYRQSVLIAFREVEDQLAALRILDQEAAIQRRAVDAAQRSLMQATNRYRGGLASYLEVTSAQNAALANELTAAGILTRRMNASVLLMKGLGGGWQASALGPE
jgi:NodT family efflux transporter outer membrane factor (OMF) lipoprotein